MGVLICPPSLMFPRKPKKPKNLRLSRVKSKTYWLLLTTLPHLYHCTTHSFISIYRLRLGALHGADSPRESLLGCQTQKYALASPMNLSESFSILCTSEGAVKTCSPEFTPDPHHLRLQTSPQTFMIFTRKCHWYKNRNSFGLLSHTVSPPPPCGARVATLA